MALKEQLIKFASETSIHAFGYMAQSSASSAKRWFWICLFTGAVTYAGVQINTVVDGKSSNYGNTGCGVFKTRKFFG